MTDIEEKEIDEMARNLCLACNVDGNCSDCWCYDKDNSKIKHCSFKDKAIEFFKIGYRKPLQAKWVNASNKTTFKCSNCGAEPMYSPSNGVCYVTLSEYCPNCGAKMEQEDYDD